MKIDPYAWLLTVPLTIGLVQIWFLPADHALKRVWRSVLEAEADVWFRLHRGLYRPEPGQVGYSTWLHRAGAYLLLIGVFAVASLLSFASFIGVLPQ